MKKLFKRIIYGCSIFLTSLVCYGQQNGIVKTDRTSPTSIVSFSQNSTLTGIGNAKHVDGYVKKYGAALFAFPVGHNGTYRPFLAEADGTTGAYFFENANAASSSIEGPFPVANKEGTVTNISTKEFWDINGTNATKLTLSWNAASAIATLTGNSLSLLSILGYNVANSRWEKISSLVDEVAIPGGASSLTSGSITTTASIVPNQYKVYTLGAINAAITPASYAGTMETSTCTEITGWVWNKNYQGSAVTVELVEGNVVHATALANIYREGLKNAGTGTGIYGFSIPTPQSLMDGQPRQLSIRVRGSNFTLAGSPRSINCGFGGDFEVADCNTISGWAWDKNAPGAAFNVELLEGNTVYATASASSFRQNVKDAGNGTGNYGFSFPTPVGLKDGKEHQVSIRIKGTTFILQNSLKTVKCVSPVYEGYFEYADCNIISGWVWDHNYPNAEAVVELVEGNTVYATATANIFKQYIKDAGYGTGKYAFNIPLPQSLKDGQAHQLNIRVKGAPYTLETPKTITCAANDYYGGVDYINCDVISGWVWDNNFPNTALTVEVMEGNVVRATSTAGTYRPYIKAAGYGTGNYGFDIPMPAILKDGLPHQLTVRVKSGNYVLVNSPTTITCSQNEYLGYFEYANCNTVSGWVWDKNSPNSSVIVELVEGNTVYATATASTFGQHIKDAGYGTGNYAFNIPLPAALKDGRTHQLNIRVKDKSYNLLNPKALTCTGNDYLGYFEYATCNSITGWVWDKNAPSASAIIELVEGSTVLATATAGTFSQHIKNAGYGTGNYAFNIPLPTSLKDGQSHQLNIRVKGSNYNLLNPKTLTCTGNDYLGFFEYATCNSITGWVWDKNAPNASAIIELVEGSTVLATATASTFSQHIKDAGYGTGNYAFNIPLPASLKDGQPHQLNIRVKGSSYNLLNPKTITCLGNEYYGGVDNADCDIIRGWVWDKNFPNAVLTVEVMEGNTVRATSTAGTYRPYIKAAGYGTGNYGFDIPMPAILKDGLPHQLTVRVKSGNYILVNSPTTITCSKNEYLGYFEYADCNAVSGWIWDKNFPNSAVIVELVEGNTVYATTTASTFKQYIKDAGYGTGNYWFSMPVPASLKNGQTHQLNIRVKGGNYNLQATKTINCTSSARIAAISENQSNSQPIALSGEPGLDLVVAPNPTNGKISVTFGLGEKLKANLMIVNILGQVIWKESAIGTNEVKSLNVDLGQQADGIYLFKLQVGQKTEIKRIVLVK